MSGKLPGSLKGIAAPPKANWVGDWEQDAAGKFERPFTLPSWELSPDGIRIELRGTQDSEGAMKLQIAMNDREWFTKDQAAWVFDKLSKAGELMANYNTET